MATAAAPEITVVPPVDGDWRAFVDRWLFVGMATWLIVVVLVGFVPDSVGKLSDVSAGRRAALPLAMHFHAVLMGSWLLLLLVQTTLMATGRKALHRRTGRIGMVLAPGMVFSGLVLVPVNLAAAVAFAKGASPDVQASTAGFLHTMTNIALLQLRIGVSFSLLVWIGLRARNYDVGLHKRLMVLATTIPLPAAFDRMQFLPQTMPQSPLSADLWPLACVAPLFAWDLYRSGKVHRAYLIWAAVMIPGAIVVNLMWESLWWHAHAPAILYGATL